MIRKILPFVIVAAFSVQQPPGGDDVTVPIQLLPAQNLDKFTINVKGEEPGGPSKVFSQQDGMVVVNGSKYGFLATKANYSNYRLVVEYKWDPKSAGHDSGVFVHCVIPDKGPVRALEVNLVNGTKSGNTGEIWLLDGPNAKLTVDGTAKLKGGIPTKDRKNYENPLGEWNILEVVCAGGKVQTKVNGHVTLVGTDAEPKAGKICLQSNKGTIYFRSMDLLPLD